MTRRIAVVGAGMGGLAASARLAQLGHDVTLFEARAQGGGLASKLEVGGLSFDAGPYILLDRPGLEWAFEKLGIDLTAATRLRPLDPVYEVRFPDEPPFRFPAGMEATIEEIEARWPGCGGIYRDVVNRWERIYLRLAPLQLESRPGLRGLLSHGALWYAPFLARDLAATLARTGLPEQLQSSLAIWTHIAGQPPDAAPSPMALVPALFHRFGAFYPEGGIGVLPALLERRALESGVRTHFETKVSKLNFSGSSKPRVGIGSDEIEFDAVVSDVGVGTYLALLDPLPDEARARMESLPLQSPGVCAYLKVRGGSPGSYLSFRLDSDSRCRLLIQPRALGEASHTARLLAPCTLKTREDQERYLDALVAEDWWRKSVTDFEVVARRVPASWGREFHLYRDSMNPVMTARLMRRGRLSHRSPYVRGLYLAGSATHPGQWVSFCAISGVLAAETLHQDYRSCS